MVLNANTQCWGCNSFLELPPGVQLTTQEQPILLKCTHCGAVNGSSQPAFAWSLHNNNSGHANNSQPKPPSRPILEQLTGTILVTFMVLIILTVAAICIFAILPRVCSDTLVLFGLLYPAAGWVLINILGNYYLAASKHPGPVNIVLEHAKSNTEDDTDNIQVGHFQPAKFENYFWCARCNYPKPPGTHHCSSCGCINGMDHHCVYINQCVGTNNYRNFLLLCGWLVGGLNYALLVLALFGLGSQETIIKHSVNTWRRGANMHFPIRVASYSLRWLISAPPWLCLWGFSAAISIGAVVALSLLLWRQLRLAARGITHLENLKSKQDGATSYLGGENKSANNDRLWAILGPPRTWMWPIYRPMDESYVKKGS